MKDLSPFRSGLYGITAEAFSRGRRNSEVVAQMLAGGVRIIQYRERDKPQREQLEECRLIRRLTVQAGAVFIVNDDPALALLAGADGVHVGQDDFPAEAVRALVGPEKIIGVSTHAPEHLQAALAGGADYVGVGPLFPTATKKDVCPPVGLAYLDYARAHCPLPWVAIGGIKEHNLAEVLEHGAACVAMVTEIVGADDIASLAARLQALMARRGGRPGV